MQLKSQKVREKKNFSTISCVELSNYKTAHLNTFSERKQKLELSTSNTDSQMKSQQLSSVILALKEYGKEMKQDEKSLYEL